MNDHLARAREQLDEQCRSLQELVRIWQDAPDPAKFLIIHIEGQNFAAQAELEAFMPTRSQEEVCRASGGSD